MFVGVVVFKGTENVVVEASSPVSGMCDLRPREEVEEESTPGYRICGAGLVMGRVKSLFDSVLSLPAGVGTARAVIARKPVRKERMRL